MERIVFTLCLNAERIVYAAIAALVCSMLASGAEPKFAAFEPSAPRQSEVLESDVHEVCFTPGNGPRHARIRLSVPGTRTEGYRDRSLWLGGILEIRVDGKKATTEEAFAYLLAAKGRVKARWQETRGTYTDADWLELTRKADSTATAPALTPDRFTATDGRVYQRGADGFYREVAGAPVVAPTRPFVFSPAATTPGTVVRTAVGASTAFPGTTGMAHTITPVRPVVRLGGTGAGCLTGA